jgi:dihydrodipicolinate synthase/N-acetylneuraminate lyase
MVSHPNTVGVVTTLDHQERLRVAANARDAAKARIAASAHVGDRSPRTGLQTARLAVAAWLSDIVTRAHGARQMPVSPPLSSSK